MTLLQCASAAEHHFSAVAVQGGDLDLGRFVQWDLSGQSPPKDHNILI